MGRKRYNIGGDNIDNSGMIWDIVRALILCLAGAALLCWATSCFPKVAPGSEYVKEVHDTTTLIQTERYDSLIFVPIPLEKNQVIVNVGDTSRLETSVARSLAFVDSTGLLHHSLENRNDKTLAAIVSIPAKTIWTNVNNSKFEQLVPPVAYVEKELTWWQKFRLDAFWPLITVLILLLAWTFRKLIF